MRGERGDVLQPLASHADILLVLAELTSLKKQHDVDQALVRQQLSSMELSLRTLAAWTTTAGHAAPAPASAPPAPKGSSSVLGRPYGDASEPSAAAPDSHKVHHVNSSEGDQEQHAGKSPRPFIEQRPDLAEKQHLLGDPRLPEAQYSDGADKDKDGMGSRPSTSSSCWGVIRQIFWDRLLMPHEKNTWDVFIMLLLLWVCFGTPVVICFGLESEFWKGHPLGIIQLVVDVCFLMDMYLSFRTAYIDKRGNLVTNRNRIAKAYLHKWFVPDLISVLPLHFFLGSWSELTTLFKLLRVIRFAKIMRLLRSYRSQPGLGFPRFIEWLDMSIDKSLLNIYLAIFSIIVALHMAACIFYYMAYLKGLGPSTWVGAYLIAPDATLWVKYLNSLYWAATTITTVGYGDITPKTVPEKLVAIPLMILGVNLLGFITSSISNTLQIRNASQRQIDTKKQMVRMFLKERNIPRDLATRVTRFFHCVSLNEVRKEEKDIVEDLPPKLRSRVLNYMYEDTIQKVPALQGQHPDLLAMIVSNLRLEYYMKSDIVTCQGDPPQGMYFIGEGRFEVRSYEVQDLQDAALLLSATTEDDLVDWPWQLQGHMAPPGFWGQTSTMADLPVPATVVACGFCELFLLPAEELDLVLERFPEVRDVLQPYQLPESLRQTLSQNSGSMKRGTMASHDIMIQSEYPHLSLATDVPAERKTALSRLSNLFTSRRSSNSPTPLARPSVEPWDPTQPPLARMSNNPLARPSTSFPPLGRPSTSLPPLGRPSTSHLGHPSMQPPLGRRSLASMRSSVQSFRGASGGSDLERSGDVSPDTSVHGSTLLHAPALAAGRGAGVGGAPLRPPSHQSLSLGEELGSAPGTRPLARSRSRGFVDIEMGRAAHSPTQSFGGLQVDDKQQQRQQATLVGQASDPGVRIAIAAGRGDEGLEEIELQDPPSLLRLPSSPSRLAKTSLPGPWGARREAGPGPSTGSGGMPPASRHQAGEASFTADVGPWAQSKFEDASSAGAGQPMIVLSSSDEGEQPGRLRLQRQGPGAASGALSDRSLELQPIGPSFSRSSPRMFGGTTAVRASPFAHERRVPTTGGSTSGSGSEASPSRASARTGSAKPGRSVAWKLDEGGASAGGSGASPDSAAEGLGVRRSSVSLRSMASQRRAEVLKYALSSDSSGDEAAKQKASKPT